MRFCQVEELLDWIRAFHDELAKQYDGLTDQSVKERTSLLLAYLADHQRLLADSIQKYETDTADSLLATWSDQCPDLELPQSLGELQKTLSGKETADIVNQAIYFHDQLIRIYKDLQEAAASDSVKELFDGLAEMEEHEKLRMVRDSLYLEDY